MCSPVLLYYCAVGDLIALLPFRLYVARLPTIGTVHVHYSFYSSFGGAAKSGLFPIRHRGGDSYSNYWNNLLVEGSSEKKQNLFRLAELTCIGCTIQPALEFYPL